MLRVHQLFEKQVAKAFDALAVVSDERRIRYGTLNQQANRLAHWLRARGVGPDQLVGLCLERSVEMVVGILGIAKAGGAYVPLEPSYPDDRLAFLLADTGVSLVLTATRQLGKLAGFQGRILCLDADEGQLSEQPVNDPESGVGPDHLAYVIYTSGSTGKPKGVLSTHRGLSNRLLWMQEAFQLTADDAVLQKTPYSFDVSVWEFFWPLMVGAKLVLVPPGRHGDSALLGDLMAAERVTTVHFVPSMLSAFLAGPDLERCTALTRVICSGEALPYELAQAFLRRSGASLHNLYGPTEASIDVSAYPCRRDDVGPLVPIGKPITGITLHVLDDALRPVSPGEVGELCIGGVGVARGYLNRPALSAERFLPDPFAREPGGRLYRTGDLCRQRDDGHLEYLGRRDHQLKIRGFRVELGEIEVVLRQHPALRDVVVVAREDDPGALRLVAYWVAAESGSEAESALVGHARSKLPEPMVPSVFVELPQLPLTSHGKVDRGALPVPDKRPPAPGKEAAFVGPRTALEAVLAERLRAVLHVERLGVHDDFFALGGDSLGAARVINRLQQELGEIIHTVALFQAPTVHTLAAYLERRYPEAIARAWGVVVEGPARVAKRSLTESDIARLQATIAPLQHSAGAASPNPPALFVLSPPRSGSTLLRVMLAGHSALFAPPELALLSFSTLAERRLAYAEPRWAFALEGTLRAWMEVQGCDAAEARRFLDECASSGMSTGAFYRLLQERIGGRLLVDKTPSYAMHPSVLAHAEALFEGARYIHLVRHPHDMTRSFVEARLDEVFLREPYDGPTDELAEAVWTLSHQNILTFLDSIPSQRKHRVVFEQLVRQPEAEMHALCAFLGLPFEASMLRPYEDHRARMTDGLHDVSRMLGDVKFHQHEGIDPSVADRWKRLAPERELGQVTWSLAARLGYPPPGPTRLVPRGANDAPAPLSFAQQRLWFLDQLDPHDASYNLPMALRFSGPLCVPLLERALEALIERHAALRTTFPAQDGKPYPRVGPVPPVTLPAIETCEADLSEHGAREAAAPFDLASGPLLRATLLRLGAEEHVLLLTVHHIVSDGWSLGLLFRDLGALYQALVEGRDPALARPAIDYADYAAWQRETLRDDVLEAQVAYWREQLAGAPAALDLPTDFPRPAILTHAGRAVPVAFSRDLLQGLLDLGRREGATLFMTLLAAFQVVLHRYSGQHEIVVGSPTAGRTLLETEDVVGFFASALALRVDLSGRPSFRQVLQRARNVTQGALAHQDAPFERLVETLAPTRDLSRSPLFQVMFVLQRGGLPSMRLGDTRLQRIEAEHVTAKLELTLSLRETDDGLFGTLEYNRALFAHDTVERMVGHLQTLLEGALAAPDVCITDLPLLTPGEQQALREAWSGPRDEGRRPACAHQLFEAQVRRSPDATAVIFEGTSLSYRDLNSRADRLARRLRQLGAGPDVLVGLCVERSLGMVVGLLGILKAGSAYVPLDPSYPKERLAFMLEDSGAPLLVTQASLPDPFPEGTHQTAYLDDTPSELATPTSSSATTSEHLAYVIYTSGSTGAPKGVGISHGAAVNFLRSMAVEPGFSSGDRLLAVTSLSFDIALLELLLPLTLGGSLEVVSRDLASDGPALAQRLRASGATVLQATPATFQMLSATNWEGSPSLKVLVGGEAVPGDLVQRLVPRTASIWNMYGPTETTVWSCVQRLDADEGPVPIGRPIANTQVLVLDDAQRPLPFGLYGELYIGGDGLARGYWRRPALTLERFVPHPFSDVPGARLYRTGDVARFRRDGVLEFRGRRDQQVKLRGFRIELREIEAVLRRHPDVRDAAVVLRDHERPGGARLVAYLVYAEGAPAPPALRDYVASKLPAPMVPSIFVALPSLPLTPNGKVDRQRLPEPQVEGLAETAEEPRTPIEAMVAGIWSSLMPGATTGVHDDFFDRGGHSLLATQLMARLGAAFGVELPLRALFEAPTIAGLAERVGALLVRENGTSTQPLVAREHGLAHRASFAQERLFFLDQWGPKSSVYNVPAALRLSGPLQPTLIEQALRAVVARHEALRTTFAIVEGQVEARIAAALDVELPVVTLDPDDLAMEVERHGETVFALDRGPLFKATLLGLSPREHVLLFTAHHSVFDGFSLGVLMRGLLDFYASYLGLAPPPAPLSIQYADYALWQRERLQGDLLTSKLAYWKTQLKGAPPSLDLPTDRPRPVRQTYPGATLPVVLAKRLSGDISALARQEEVTPFMVLLAAFQVLLARYTGQADVVVGSPSAGRSPAATEPLLGSFVNTLVLRTDLSGEPTAREVLRRVRDVALGAFSHEDVPFEKLVEELAPARDVSRSPLFQAMLTLRVPSPRLLLGELQVEAMEVPQTTAKVDLTLSLGETPEGLRGALVYNTDLFDRATVARMVGHYGALLEAVVSSPDTCISDLPMLTSAEREHLFSLCESARALSGGALIHQVFEAQVARTPEAGALTFEGETWSYRELDTRANRLSHRLRRLGVGPEVLVGLAMDRSPWLVLALLAILKAGGAYVPLDPDYPRERLLFMLNDSAALVLVTQTALLPALPSEGLVVLALDAVWAELQAEPSTPPDVAISPDNLAYVIYTSGSTGRPRGVQVTHQNVTRLFATSEGWFAFGPADVWTLFHSYAFDFSVWELWGALFYGGRLVVVPFTVSRAPEAFHALLRQEQVSVLSQTPSAFRSLVAADAAAPEDDPLALRLVIFGGEAVDLPSLTPWFARHGDERPQLVNMYGITETTVHVSYRPLRVSDIRAASPSPLGRPLPDLQVYVLDRGLRLQPLGVPGELHVGGPGVARGYLGRPALTAERMVPDPFATEPGARLYRTGDLGRLLANGELEYLGRLDHQVKIRGFRIELGEIEAALLTHPQVREAVVVVREDEPGQKRLVAYFAAEGASPALRALRLHLQQTLPEHMIPAAFVELSELPLTSQGKRDRRALPPPFATRLDLDDAYAPPRTPEEELLTEVWADVLRVARVGIHDNFFELGGDSIRSIQVLARARDAGLPLSLPALFQHQTIARLMQAERGELLSEALSQAPFALISAADRALVPDDVEDAYPLAELQTGMLFHSDLHPASPLYHDVFSYHLAGRVDPEDLCAVLAELCELHPMLRVSFDMATFTEPLQLVHRRATVPLMVVDLTGLSFDAAEAALLAFVEQEKRSPFAWNLAPLLRVFMHPRAGDTTQITLSFHHAILDGWSVASLNAALRLGLRRRGTRPQAIPALRSTFADFVALERGAIASEASRRYWSERLAGALVTTLPRAQGARFVSDIRIVEVPIAEATSHALVALARRASVPLKSALLAAHLRVLRTIGGSADVVSGLVTNGRPETPDAERALGLYLNTLPFRQRVHASSWVELLRETFAIERGMLPHRRFPLAEIQTLVGGPLFEVLFNFVHFHVYKDLMSSDAAPVLSQRFVEQTNFKLAATFGLSPVDARVRLTLQLDADLSDPQVDELCACYERTLIAMTEQPDRPPHAVQVLSDEAQRRVLALGVGPPRTQAAPSIHRMFEAQVARAPAAWALVAGTHHLRYDELNARANRWARRLRTLGVGPEVLVGLCVSRSLAAIVGILAVLKAGGAYVPLDPSAPKERLAFLLNDARPAVLLTQTALLAGLPDTTARVISLDDEGGLDELSSANLEGGAQPENLAYVIYTSGSTGAPKGVMVEHRSATGLGDAMHDLIYQRYEAHGPLHATLNAPLFFDGSVERLQLLMRGHCLHIVSDEVRHDAVAFVRYVRENRLHSLDFTPSQLRVLIEAGLLHDKEHRPLAVSVGGEAIDETLWSSLASLSGTDAFNVYGPTECTVNATACRIRDFAQAPTIGKALLGYEVYVLGDDGEVLPVGVAGELWVGGVGVARGYWQRAALSAERFRPGMFGGAPGRALYCTGDRCRFREDGSIEYLGRSDQQVKIRGFRVELGEIEASLTRHPDVREAAVVAADGGAGSARLVAYVVPSPGTAPAPRDLRSYLATTLPDYMVPSLFVELPRLPLTPNGKVDLRALPPPSERPASDEGVDEAPRTPLEEVVTHVVAEVLHLPTVAVSDNFFELGGHSLSATQLIGRLRSTLGVDLPLRALFDAPTLGALARDAAALLRTAGAPPRPPLVALDDDARGPYPPLSFSQRRLWFLDQMEPGSASYGIPVAYRLRGPLDQEALQRSIDALVRRHEALRTTFHVADGEPYQHVTPEGPTVLPVFDVTPSEALAWARREAETAFDLSLGPLYRGALLRLAPDEHVLLWTIHHAVSDAWSARVWSQELSALYAAFSSGNSAPLPELAIRYRDYALWQRQGMEALAPGLSYWKGRLAAAPPALDLPLDHPRPARWSYEGGAVPFVVGEDLTRELKALSRREGVTLFMTLLATFQVLLYRHTGQEDIVVGAPAAGREPRETEGLVGFFVNTLVLRGDLSGRPTFRELLSRVRELTLGAYAHQDVPFEMLVEELSPTRDLGRSPLFQVSLVLQDGPLPSPTFPGISVERLPPGPPAVKVDLTLALVEAEGELRCVFEYSTALFERTRIERMAGHFQILLRSVVSDSGRPVGALPMLSERERADVLTRWNAGVQAAPPRCIHRAFEARAELTPEAVALVLDGEHLSYRALNERANQLAHHLRRLGVGPGVLVALCMERSLTLVVGIFAVWKAGGAHVPLDPTAPPERLAFMLQDTAATVLLTERKVSPGLPPHNARALLLDSLAPLLAAQPTGNLDGGAGPDDLAYVIYTSGSSGRPKGVLIEHRSATALGDAMDERLYAAYPGPLAAAINATFIFDGSVERLLLLTRGHTLHLISEEARHDVHALMRYVDEHRLDSVDVTPSQLRLLLEAGWLSDAGYHPRTISVGGEAIDEALWAALVRLPDTDAFNNYGPTECTINTTSCRVRDFPDAPTLGRPLSGYRVYVLDANLELLPAGVEGELCVGGVGVARGYLNRPELTDERFVPDPFSSLPGARLYRTGDRGRFRPDGTLQFLGRVDNQVKLRGFRIELGEIEAALAEHAGLREVTVQVRQDGGDARLVAYVVGRDDTPPSFAELRSHLAQRLPDYMLPGAFVALSALPLTPHGKLDRQALPAPELTPRAGPVASPRTPVEVALLGLWSDLLHVPELGVSDDFFALGGHSLLATQAMARVRSIFGVELPLRALFEVPTVEGLAARIERALGVDGAATLPRLQAVVSETRTRAPASFAQQRLWFLDQLAPGQAHYNVPIALRLRGALDRGALEQALRTLELRHEALRTTFQVVDGQLQQCMRKEPCLRLAARVVDAVEVQDTAEREAQAPFDLATGPLVRATLLEVSPSEHVLLWTLHHIVADGWSTDILVRELGALYQASVAGKSAQLPALAIQYADFAVWQRSWLAGEVLEAKLSYWRAQLRDLPPALTLPSDRPRPAVPSYAGGAVPVALSPKLSAALQALCRREGVTLFMALLAAFQVLLKRYSGQDDIVVGSPIAGRAWVETEGVVGLFVNTLALRGDLSGEPTFRELLGRVRDTTLGAYTHHDVPFERLVEELSPSRDLSRSPLFQVMLLLQTGAPSLPDLGDLQVEVVSTRRQTSTFDLTLSLGETPEGLRGALVYSADLFDRSTIERAVRHYETLLEAVVADPSPSVARLPVLSADEREALLAASAGPVSDNAPACTLHGLFEQQVARTPHATALVFEEHTLSYAELNARANQLARQLRRRGVGPGNLVALCLTRSHLTVIGLFGVLKAGAAYVPLDPSSPSQRLDFMLRDTAAVALLTETSALALFSDPPQHVVCLDELAASLADEARDDLGLLATPHDLAYVLYTSGSTGEPKGVLVEHRAATGLGDAMFHMIYRRYQELGPLRASLNAPFIFDGSVERLLLLTRGHTLYVVSDEVRRDAAALVAYVRRHRLQSLDVTPSQLRVLMEAGLFQGSEPRPLALSIGGEAIDDKLWSELASLPGTDSFNVYGPTECTVNATAACIADTPQRPTIGRPLRGYRVYLLDAHMQLVPRGVPGEIHVGGVGVARGYLNRPALTEERFVPDPFSIEPGAILYKTGDRARLQADGTLAFLGRVDRQVKLRGVRVELGEIERALAESPFVDEVVVTVRDDLPTGPGLVAYLVPREGTAPTTADLRSHARAKLPDVMAPTAYVLLPAFPLSPSGKVDLQALPLPDLDGLGAAGAYVAPKSPVEELIAGIWSEVLRAPRVGVSDNFFELGGHSLIGTQVVGRMGAVLGREVPLRLLFEAPTVVSLAAEVQRLLAGEAGVRPPPLLPADSGSAETAPLSFAQERLWFLDRLEPGSAFYNIPAALRLRGTLDVSALEKSIQALVERHASLRATFPMVDGKPTVRQGSAAQPTLAVVEVTEGEVGLAAAREAATPFSLATGPLFRARLLRVSADNHALLLTLHHIVSDGWSMALLLGELAALYEAFATGRPSPLPALPLQYTDFARWQRAWLTGPILDAKLGYWKEQLRGAPPALDLATDRPRPTIASYRGSAQALRLPTPLVKALEEVCRREGVTLFMALLAAFQALLQRYTGQEEIVVGAPVAGRATRETEGLVGFFVNTLPLRTSLAGRPTFRQLLGRVREVTLAAYSHQDVPFEKLVEELNPLRDPSRSPLFQAMLVLQNAPTPPASWGAVEVSDLQVEHTTAKMELSLVLHQEEGGLRGALLYNTDLYERDTAARLTAHYELLLEALVSHPDRAVVELPILTPVERQQQLVTWNDSGPEGPSPGLVHALFEAQARRSPDADALLFQGQHLTYAELDLRASQWAHDLRALGVGPESVVGLCVDRSPSMVVGLLAILKAGGAYLPLDPSYPAERLRFMLRDSGARVLLTEQRWTGLFEQRLPMVCVDAWTSSPQPKNSPKATISSENLAYVIYTSGSTGRPKGVQVEHRSACNLARAQAKLFGLDGRHRVLQFAALSFDAAVWEVLMALTVGATLMLAPREALMPGPDLHAVLREGKINALTLPPSALAVMPSASLPDLEVLVVAGEPCPAELVARWAPGRRFFNAYGPTETTVCATIQACVADGERPPVGRPLAGVRVYVLDPNLLPVPVGVAGELYVGGAGVSRGYLAQPALTAARFVPDPFASEPGARLYKTGDRCRLRRDGALLFLGRSDRQVKVRGFRVEPGEVEHALTACANLRAVAVAARQDVSDELQLVAYLVAADAKPPEHAELRRRLEARLPHHMIPGAFVWLPELPLSPTGKVDHARLPAPTASPAREQEAPVSDMLEASLLRIWQRVLRRPVDLHTSFFDLGGTSLRAVELFARVSDTLGHKVPMATLFVAPTVAELAAAIRAHNFKDPWQALLPIRASGARPPLYCVHGALGGVIVYRNLAKHLGPDHPVYAFQAEDMGKSGDPRDSIEAIARSYVTELKHLDPVGPYHLLGHSFGGLLAAEMARQLLRDGADVAFLGLLDTSPRRAPERADSAEPRAPRADLTLASLASRAKAWIERSVARQTRRVQGQWDHYKTAAAEGRGRTLLELALHRRRALAHAANLSRAYHLRDYPGKVTLFCAEQWPEATRQALVEGWAAIAQGGVEVVVVPGSHYSLLEDENVVELARWLRARGDAPR